MLAGAVDHSDRDEAELTYIANLKHAAQECAKVEYTFTLCYGYSFPHSIT